MEVSGQLHVPTALTPVKNPGTHSVGRMGALEKTNSSCSCLDSNLGSSQPVSTALLLFYRCPQRRQISRDAAAGVGFLYEEVTVVGEM